MSSGNLAAPGFERAAFEGTPFNFMPGDNPAQKTLVLTEKTLARLDEEFSAADADLAADDLPDISSTTTDGVTTYTVGTTDGTAVPKPTYTPPGPGSDSVQGDDPFTQTDESEDDVAGNGATNIFSVDTNGDATADAATLKTYLEAWGAAVADIDLDAEATTAAEYTARAKYEALVEKAKDLARPKAKTAHDTVQATAKTTHEAAEDDRAMDPMYRQNVGGNAVS